MTVYGYLRVSTDKQDCDNQKIGVENLACRLNLLIEENKIGGYNYLFRTVAAGAKTVYDHIYSGTLHESRRESFNGKRRLRTWR